MELTYPMIRKAVRTNPKVLTALKDPKKIAYANSFLPKDTGIEFEVALIHDNTAEGLYRYYIKSNHIDYSLVRNTMTGFNRDTASYPEKRFRIKNGVQGMIQLFNISLFMTKYGLLNEKSVIHMHVGTEIIPKTKYSWMTSTSSPIEVTNLAKKYLHLFDPSMHDLHNRSELTKQNWINFNSRYNTLEYRGIPLSFKYSHLIRYAIICQNITQFVNK